MIPKLVILVPIMGILSGCVDGSTSPSEIPDIVRAEWAIGQELSREFVGDDAFSVHPEQFKWQSMPGPFDCSGVPANGCYSHGFGRSSKIRWNSLTPTVIRHEAGHAILDKLNHPCARDFQHTVECGT